MIGSGAAASLIAQVAFWAILGIGVAWREVRMLTALVFVLLWGFGVFGLPRVSEMGALFVTSYVAILDIILTFVVFKGNVRLS